MAAQPNDDTAPTPALDTPESAMRWRRRVLPALVALLTGCVTWREIPIPTPPAPPNVLTDVSRVRLTTGEAPEFLTLVVATDSLFGVRKNLARTRMSIALEQVRRIEVRKKDGPKTLGLLTLIAVGAFYTGVTGARPR